MDVMRSRQMLLLCALASLGLHIALLVYTQPLSAADTQDFGLQKVGRGLHLKLVFQSAPVLLPASDALVPEAGAEPTASAPLDTNAPALPVAAAYSEAMPAGGASEGADPSLSAGSLLPLPEYIPSQYLTFVPKPLGPVEVPFPAAATDEVRVRILLSLFIDESGHVNQVSVDNAQAMTVLEDAAVSTFLTTRFKPGELAGRAVRSVLRVEVIFESEGGRVRKSTVAM